MPTSYSTSHSRLPQTVSSSSARPMPTISPGSNPRRRSKQKNTASTSISFPSSSSRPVILHPFVILSHSQGSGQGPPKDLAKQSQRKHKHRPFASWSALPLRHPTFVIEGPSSLYFLRHPWPGGMAEQCNRPQHTFHRQYYRSLSFLKISKCCVSLLTRRLPAAPGRDALSI